MDSMGVLSDLHIVRLPVGPLSTNCYIVWRESEAAVIDPGCDADRIVRELRGLRCGAIINTHGHPDHIGANGALRRATGAKVYVGAVDAVMLEKPVDTFRLLARSGAEGDTLRADETLLDGQVLSVGGVEYHVIDTPGHTAGGISLWLPEDGVVFTGDTLFKMGVGRTDLGGDGHALEKSIYDVLFALPDRTRVYPGHGAATTIGDEKMWHGFRMAPNGR